MAKKTQTTDKSATDAGVNSSLVNDLTIISSLANQHATTCSKKDSYALLHVVENCSLAEWETLATLHKLQNWLFVPISESQSKAIKSLESIVETLFFQRDQDALTGVGNRRMYEPVITREFERATRTGGDLSLVMIDIDNFKGINDQYGHAAGDKVLETFGQIIKQALRSYDFAVRMGGDEFVLILPSSSVSAAELVAQKILAAISRKKFTSEKGSSFNVSISAGVSSLRRLHPSPTVALLYETADKALYTAKKNGRARVALFDDAPKKQAAKASQVLAQEKHFLCSGFLPDDHI